MLKKSTVWAIFCYGVFLILLGLYGYTATGSIISLYAGAGFGTLMLVSSLFCFAHVKGGLYSALVLTLLLTATFAYRYSTTGKAVPAILAVASGGMLLFLLAQTARWKN